MDGIRFSLNHLPTKQRYGPKVWVYFDLILNNQEYAKLKQGREEYEGQGLRLAIITLENAKDKKRKESPDFWSSMD